MLRAILQLAHKHGKQVSYSIEIPYSETTIFSEQIKSLQKDFKETVTEVFCVRSEQTKITRKFKKLKRLRIVSS
jgi:hypothetical protein